MSLNLDRIITDVRDSIPNNKLARKTSKHFFRGKSDKLYVVTPYWQATINQFPMKMLKRRILKKGHSCLIYQFPVKILSEDVRLTERYFKEIENEVRKDIEDI